MGTQAYNQSWNQSFDFSSNFLTLTLNIFYRNIYDLSLLKRSVQSSNVKKKIELCKKKFEN